jgi:hypothetical protein
MDLVKKVCEDRRRMEVAQDRAQWRAGISGVETSASIVLVCLFLWLTSGAKASGLHEILIFELF